MKLFYILFTCLISAGALSAQTHISKQWVSTYSSADSLLDTPTAIDVNGNVYVAGFSVTNTTSCDFTILKYDINGNLLWTRNYNGTANGCDQVAAITVDAAMNVYVTGRGA